MPYAVELFFDQATDTAIRRIWRILAQREIALYLYQSANRPHLTVALYDDLALTQTDATLAQFAAETPRLPLTLALLGVFPLAREAVVFTAPIVTSRLLALHARLHALLTPMAVRPDEQYIPERWVAHCSLATHCPPERVLDALTVSLGLPLPLDAWVEEVGVVQTSPARPQFSHRLHMLQSR